MNHRCPGTGLPSATAWNISLATISIGKGGRVPSERTDLSTDVGPQCVQVL